MTERSSHVRYAHDWASVYRAALADVEKLACSRELMTPELTLLLDDLRMDVHVIEHAQDNRLQRYRLRAAKEAAETARQSTLFDADLDSKLSYDAAIREIGQRVNSGAEPVPTTGYFALREKET